MAILQEAHVVVEAARLTGAAPEDVLDRRELQALGGAGDQGRHEEDARIPLEPGQREEAQDGPDDAHRAPPAEYRITAQ